MEEIDIEKAELYFDLKDVYISKYGSTGIPEEAIFPIEFLDIDDYELKNILLTQALSENKRLEELEYIIELHDEKNIQKINEGIEESISRMNK